MTVSREPRYPEVEVQLHTSHPLAWISAVRQGLRRQGIDGQEIHRFTQEAFEAIPPHRVQAVCSSWATIERLSLDPSAS